MSRIGKKIIEIPPKTTASMSGSVFTVKGPLGELSRDFGPRILITITDKEITMKPVTNTLELNALWGTVGSHITNMVMGVNKAFEKKLMIEGIGYKAEVKGDKLAMSLGFSHPVVVPIPSTLKVTSEKNIITISGTNNEDVGQFTAYIRSLKKPEPYKGKGIMYVGEVIRRKQGKKTT